MTLTESADAVRKLGDGPLQPSALFELVKDLGRASAARYQTDTVMGPAIASFLNQQDAYDWFAKHPERSRLTITADTNLGWSVRGYCRRDQVTE